MSLTKLLPVILLMMATGVQASTRDEIERLWNPQGMAVQPAQPAADTSARTEKPAPRWFRLSNGRQVNLADWKVVLFMQGHCPYCHQFDPVLKQLAQQYGFSVFPYTLDGQGDTAFPEALPVPPDVMQTFFPNIPVATPTTFLVNVNTLEGLGAAGRRQVEIDRVAPLVDCPVQVGPLAPHLDVGFIQAPARIKATPPEPAQPLLHLRGVALDPAIDRRMVDRNAAFRQHFLKVAIADRIATIPAHRPQDHITLEMAPLEIRHRSVRPISAKHAQASRFLQQSR